MLRLPLILALGAVLGAADARAQSHLGSAAYELLRPRATAPQTDLAPHGQTRSNPVWFDFDALDRAHAGDRFRATFFDDVSMVLVLEERELITQAPIGYHWLGRIEGEGDAQFAITVCGGAVASWFCKPAGQRETVSFHGNRGQVFARAFEPRQDFCGCNGAHDHGATNTADLGLGLHSAASTTGGCSDDPGRVDLSIYYTDSAYFQMGQGNAALAKIRNAVNQTNACLSNSGVPLRINTVLEQRFGGVGGLYERTSFSQMLQRVRDPSDGEMDFVYPDRIRDGSDLVAVVVGDFPEHGQVRGLAYKPVNLTTFDPDRGFSVNSIGSLTENYVLAHELGHNFGCSHDSQNTSGARVTPQALGYNQKVFDVWPVKEYLLTVMSYQPACTGIGYGCFYNRVPYFSNPNRSHDFGGLIGRHNCGNSSTQNFAAIDLTRGLVANYSREIANGGPPQMRRITVDHTNSSTLVPIQITTDRHGNGDGGAPFWREYTGYTSVTMTAPSSHNGLVFRRWLIDGEPQEAGETTYSFCSSELTSSITVYAEYCQPRTRELRYVSRYVDDGLTSIFRVLDPSNFVSEVLNEYQLNSRQVRNLEALRDMQGNLRYHVVFEPLSGGGSQGASASRTRAQFQSAFDSLPSGHVVRAFSSWTEDDGERRYAYVISSHPPVSAQVLRLHQDRAAFDVSYAYWPGQGYRLQHLDTYVDPDGTRRFDSVWATGSGAHAIQFDVDQNTFLQTRATNLANGLELAELETTYDELGDLRYYAVYRADAGTSFVSVCETAAELQATRNHLVTQGWRLDDLEPNYLGTTPARTYYGNGLRGTHNVPWLEVSNMPVIGRRIGIRMGNSYQVLTPTTLLLGVRQTGIPLLGGTLLVDPLIGAPVTLSPTGTIATLQIPYDLALDGAAIHVQHIQIDPGAPQGVAFSRGMTLTFGRVD